MSDVHEMMRGTGNVPDGLPPRTFALDIAIATVGGLISGIAVLLLERKFRRLEGKRGRR